MNNKGADQPSHPCTVYQRLYYLLSGIYFNSTWANQNFNILGSLLLSRLDYVFPGHKPQSGFIVSKPIKEMGMLSFCKFQFFPLQFVKSYCKFGNFREHFIFRETSHSSMKIKLSRYGDITVVY